RFASRMGNAVRCRATLPCRRLPEPESGRRRVASLDEGRPPYREHRFGTLVRLRTHACAEAGGLAGDAGCLDRFPPEARGLLRSEPSSGCATPERLTALVRHHSVHAKPQKTPSLGGGGRAPRLLRPGAGVPSLRTPDRRHVVTVRTPARTA